MRSSPVPTVVGQPAPRIDGWAKVTGAHEFLSDLKLGPCLWAAVIRSPHPKAKLLALNQDELRAHPDVVAVFTAADLPSVRYNAALAPDGDCLRATADQRMLASMAHYAGDGVAVVVADTRAAAAAAAAAARPTWQVLPAVLDVDTALARGQVLARMNSGEPDVARILSSSPVVVSETFEVSGAQHVCMETHQCAAVPDGAGGITLLSNTQSPAALRQLVARVTGLSEERLRVLKVAEGGGFGCRQEMYEEALTCWLALRLAEPVRVSYSRAEELNATRRRHAARIAVTLGATRDGVLLAADVSAVIDSGAYASHTPYVASAFAAAAQSSYPRLRARFRGQIVRTNTLPTGAYRGYGLSQANFAIESAIDKLAKVTRIDPVELRLRNLPDRPRLAECLVAGRARFGWPGDVTWTGPVGRGHGVAIAAKGTTFGDESDTSRASVTIRDDSAVLLTGTCDSGTGSSTVLAQVVAEELGIPLQRVSVQEGDTSAGPVDVGSSAQRSVMLGAGAARLAALAAREGLTSPVTFRAERTPASYTACFATVTVDTELGVVSVEECLLVTDCGSVLNPLGAHGQVQGGAAQGIGLALMDLWQADDEGNGPASIQEHAVPTAVDIPAVDVMFVGEPAPASPYGALGLGELPIVPVAAAIANAIASVTGVTVRQTPMRPDVIWRALAEGQR